LKSTKLYIALSTFKTPKLNQFVKFVSSPFFNANEELIALSNLLVRGIKNNNLGTTEEVYKVLHPKKEYNSQKFRTTCTKLLNLVEEFIIETEFSKDSLVRDSYLIQGINDENIEVLFKKANDKAERNLDRNLERSSNYFLQKYIYELGKYKKSSKFEKQSVSGDPLATTNLFNINPALDHFYYLSKLRFINELISYNYLYKLNIETNEFDEIESALIKKEFLDNKSINTYYLLCKVLLNPEKEDLYLDLKKLLFDQMDLFSKIEQREIFNSILNYTIRKVNSGERKYYVEILDIYELGISSEILLLDGNLASMSFRNMVMSAIRVDNYDRAHLIIEKYGQLLKEDEKQNAINFSLARIAMNQKNWKKALEHISVIDFEDVTYNLTSRLMMANAYYELEEFDVLESLINSYSIFLHRKKYIAESKKIMYLHHLRYLRKLIKVNRNDKVKLKQIEEELNKNTMVINKGWLLQKVKELL